MTGKRMTDDRKVIGHRSGLFHILLIQSWLVCHLSLRHLPTAFYHFIKKVLLSVAFLVNLLYVLQSLYVYNRYIKEVKIMRKYFLMSLVLFALIFAGCSSGIKMTSSWNDKTEKGSHIKKILVIGLFGEKSRNLRQDMEQHMADNLKKLGYNAITSYQEYGPKAFVNIPEDRAMAIIDSNYANTYDGVIIVSIVDKNSQKRYVPGYYSPYPYYGYGWGYSPFYSPFYSPYTRGYYKTDTHYSFEANFYDLSNKKILYSGQSDVYNPSSPGSLAIDYSRIILKDMRKKNILS